MLSDQFILPLAHELVVDLFAGGGGASTGIEQAIGRHVDIAVNHDPQAVSLHQANHPQTEHFVSDVFEVDPLAVTDGRPVGLLWASPDCKHFSKAKGGKPVSKKIRGLAWVVVKWAKQVRPRIICLENVEEFQTWGPLADDGRPCPERKGTTFARWVAQLRNLGYVVEWRELRACDYGAPTIRKRLFLVARRDGEPIVWPAPTHGPGLKPYRTAADCIDWSLPVPSIFDPKRRPLAEATKRRIAHGIRRYVLDAEKPYIVRIGHTGHGDSGKVRAASEPLSTITSKAEHCLVAPTLAKLRGTSNSAPADAPLGTVSAQGTHHALVAPTLVQTGYGEREGQAPRALDLHKPLGTCVGGQKHALVAAFLAKHYTGVVGSALAEPIGTVTSVDHHSLVAGTLVGVGGRTGQGQSSSYGAGRPMRTVTTKTDTALVASFLSAYYGSDQDTPLSDPMHTVTTKPRFALVMVDGVPHTIADIGMRMLQPRELYRAQGFPDTYIIDRGHDGRALPKDAQVRMCGNSVCPPLARAIVAANFVEAHRQAANDNTPAARAATAA